MLFSGAGECHVECAKGAAFEGDAKGMFFPAFQKVFSGGGLDTHV